MQLNIPERILFEHAFYYASVGMALVAPDGRYLKVNGALANMVGYTQEELTQRDFQSITYPPDLESDLDFVCQMLEKKRDSYQMEKRYVRKDGTIMWVMLSVSLVFRGEAPALFISQAQDITLRKEAEEKLERQYRFMEYQAEHDTLTNLANRYSYRAAIISMLKQARERGTELALLLIDLNNFKYVNDVFGHSVGDKLLKQMGARFSQSLSSVDLLARIGGDEFAILLVAPAIKARAESCAKEVLDLLKAPFDIQGNQHQIGASIGVACFPEGGENEDELLQHADIAMYEAKRNGGAAYRFFSDAIRQRYLSKMEIERYLQKAVNGNELEIYYQPIFSLKTNKIVYMEALLRWYGKDGVLVPPVEFLPIAERSQLILDIRDYVVNRVCSDLRTLIDFQLDPPRTSINFSAAQIQTVDLENLEAILNRHGILPKQLAIEITETALIEHPKFIGMKLDSLRSKGMKIFIDDFGTGYSSLSLLHNLQFDHIKVDKSFVADLFQGKVCEAIVKTIFDLAENLNMEVIAEGITHRGQLEWLKQKGCQYGQGYYFSKAMPLPDLIERLGSEVPGFFEDESERLAEQVVGGV